MQSGKTRQQKIDECNTLQELQALAEELGHKPGWAVHVWDARQKKAEKAAQQ